MYESFRKCFTVLPLQLSYDHLCADAYPLRREAVELARRHLLEEREAVASRIKELREEEALIDKHLREQARKQTAVEQEEEEAKAGADLLRKTLQGLEAKMDKARLLASAAAAAAT